MIREFRNPFLKNMQKIQGYKKDSILFIHQKIESSNVVFQRFEIWEEINVVVLFLRSAQKQHNNKFSLSIQKVGSYFKLLVVFRNKTANYLIMKRVV